MKILYLETSSKNCSVAISDGEELLCLCEEASENYKQSESLHSFVEWALEGAEIKLQDLDAICLGKGPGSYTGLRIGAASAKGFCFGLNIPMISVDSMDSMVHPFINQDYDYIIPLIDARRMEVYTSVYSRTGEVISNTEALILSDNSFIQFEGKKILFLGDGALKAKEILNFQTAVFKSDVYPSAQYLISKAVEKYDQRDFENIAYFEPFYLKDFQGIKTKKRKIK